MTKPKKPKPSEKVAVYHYNGIGNFIQMAPALIALSKLHDNCKLDLVMDKSHKDSRFNACIELAKYWPVFDGITTFSKAFKHTTYKNHFLTMHSEKPDAWIFGKTKIEYTLLQVPWGETRLHEVEFYMEQVRAMGYKGETPPKRIPIPKLRNNLASTDINIALVNGFFKEEKMAWQRKTWPYFAELADLLHWTFGAKIHLLGFNETEKKWAKEVLRNRSFITDWVGKLSFKEEIKLLSEMDVVVSTDTGLMHVADALPKPKVVALFGATLVSKNGPWNKEKAVVVKAPVQCAGCQATLPIWRQCAEVNRKEEKWPCMESIKPSLVMDKVRKMLI